MSENRRNADVTPILKKGKREDKRNHSPVSPTSIPAKATEHQILETIASYMKDKRVIKSSQRGFTKGKPCLISLISFYDEMTGLVDEGRTVDVVYLEFIEFIEKLLKNVLDEQTLNWVENWLKSQSQRVGVMKSYWWPITSSLSQELILGPNLY